MNALRTIHSGLAHLFGVLIPIQFFLAGYGAFATVHNKKFDDNNFGPHGGLGTLMVLISLIILLIALAMRPDPRVRNLSALLFGVMVVQMILGVSGAGTSEWLGALHAVNALVVIAVTFMLIRSVRHAGPEPVRT